MKGNYLNNGTSSRQNGRPEHPLLHGHPADRITLEALTPAAQYIKERIRVTPEIGIICGSGLGELGDLIENPVFLPYTDIPGFPVSTTPGHKGRLIVGTLQGVPVVLMQGRFHMYEGYPLQLVGLPVRVMKLLGIHTIIITNAVGGLNQQYKVGDIMLVRDHLNLPGLTGMNPLQGQNDSYFGNRFFAVNSMYCPDLRRLARQVAVQVDMEDKLREGILTISGGPNYESTAELRMFSMLGCDCVGMSNIPEGLVAHHTGIKILSFCLVTNMCSVDYTTHLPPNHEEVLEVAEQNKDKLKQFVTALVSKIAANS